MTFHDYRRIEAVNFSSLKWLDDSPLAYHHWTEPANEPPETAPLALGRYVHAKVLQPDQVGEEFAIWPTSNGRRAGKSWSAFVRENEGLTIFREEDVAVMNQIAESVRGNKHARAILDAQDGRAETNVTWTDAATGIACKARRDFVVPSLSVLADLKTTRSIDAHRFGNDIARYLYHGQLAHYSNGTKAAEGWAPERHVLIAVESKPPYDVAVFDLGEQAMEVGREKVAGLLQRLKECRDADDWPGRYPEPVTLDGTNLPPWVFGGSPDFIVDTEE